MDNKETIIEEEIKEAEAPVSEECECKCDCQSQEEKKECKKEKKSGEGKKMKAKIAGLEAELEAAKAQAAESNDKYLRVCAEYDNFRKRSQKEREGIYADAAADCLKELMPLIDNLERATGYTNPEKVAEGVAMILGTLPAVFEKMNVTAYGEKGDTFDPNIHNAVMHIEDEEHGEGEIVEVFQKGYKIGDKVVRYAMVQVAN